jgi:hypothetical protein
MNLLPGHPFAIAPLFQLPGDWPARLLVGSGITEVDGGFCPQQSWRTANAEELAALVRSTPDPTASAELDASIVLFHLPAHLRSQWWELLELGSCDLAEGRLPGFNDFAGHVSDFLEFKNLPVPGGARWEVALGSPVQPLLAGESTLSRAGGLRSSLAPSTPWPAAQEHGGPRLWGGINLGDEEMSLVFLNLPWQLLDEHLFQRFPDQPSPATVGELAGHFLRNCPDYPPIRLRLRPGEGYRLPRSGLILNGYSTVKQEPDLLLSISLEQRSSP